MTSERDLEATVDIGARAEVRADRSGRGSLDAPALGFGQRYHLGPELARGGLAIIRDAHDVVLDRRVAVKQLLERDVGLEERFVREARLTGRLIHPGIVPVYDVGRDQAGVPSYAMKWVAGQSLSTALAAATTLDARLALIPSVIAIAEAVAYAHDQGVLHRDLKPANVIVGAFGETVVIDWGLAIEIGTVDAGTGPAPPTLDPRLTAAGAVLGTPCYMPPEQARGQPVDTRADVYALGAILYQLVAGAAPYDVSGVHSATSTDPVWAQVAAGPPRPIAELEPAVPTILAAIIERAMARDPDARFPSARAVASELAAFLTHHSAQRLAIAALAHVATVEAAVAPGPRPSDRAAAAILRTADVARFGLEQALATWPGSPEARDGLVRLRAALFTLELGRDNLAAASVLAAELPPDAARQAALEELATRARAQATAAAAHTRATDPRTGLRERTILALGIIAAIAASLVQALIAGLSIDHTITPRRLLVVGAAAMGLIVALGLLVRRQLFANATSAAATRVVVAVVVFALANRVIGYHADTPASYTMTIDLLIIGAALVAQGSVRVAAIPLVGAVVAARWPATARLAFNLALLISMVAIVVGWRRAARPSPRDP